MSETYSNMQSVDTELIGTINELGSGDLGGKEEIYIGSGDMPEGYVLQIDPEGTADTIPTKTSELENDSGFITASELPTKTSQLVNDSGFTTASDLPSKTSQLENDSGYITADDLPANGLPSVTEADNGKVLRVVNGVWAVDAIPDSSEQVIAELESMIDESGVLA